MTHKNAVVFYYEAPIIIERRENDYQAAAFAFCATFKRGIHRPKFDLLQFFSLIYSSMDKFLSVQENKNLLFLLSYTEKNVPLHNPLRNETHLQLLKAAGPAYYVFQPQKVITICLFFKLTRSSKTGKESFLRQI